jgi:hypothetical protein
LETISIQTCSEYPLSKFYIASKAFQITGKGYALRKGINPYFKNKFEKK